MDLFGFPQLIDINGGTTPVVDSCDFRDQPTTYNLAKKPASTSSNIIN